MHAFACESNICSIFVGALARATINGKVTPTNKHAHQDKEEEKKKKFYRNFSTIHPSIYVLTEIMQKQQKERSLD